MIKVKELKGFKSLRALNVFHTLMLGLKMLPDYELLQYEEFFISIEKMNEADQEKMIRQATIFVELTESEVAALSTFCLDPNGIPYSEARLKEIPVDQIYEMIVAVSKEIMKIKIDFVTESEKKIDNFSVDPRKIFTKFPNMGLEEALNLAYYDTLYCGVMSGSYNYLKN